MLEHRIRQSRERLGWSQEDLARRLSVSQSTISGWEIGLKSPRTRIMGRLATVLGVGFEWLSTGRGPMTPSSQAGLVGETRSTEYQPEREEDENRLLVCYARLKPLQRQALLGFLESLRT